MAEKIPQMSLDSDGSISFEDKKLTPTKVYRTGKDFKESGDKYFMVIPKGVMGFKEV